MTLLHLLWDFIVRFLNCSYYIRNAIIEFKNHINNVILFNANNIDFFLSYVSWSGLVEPSLINIIIGNNIN